MEDARSPTQKAESHATIQREAAAANAMEKARLQEEARDRLDRNAPTSALDKKTGTKAKRGTTAENPGDTNTSAASSKKGHVQKKKEPEFFTARATTEKPKAKPKTKPKAKADSAQ